MIIESKILGEMSPHTGTDHGHCANFIIVIDYDATNYPQSWIFESSKHLNHSLPPLLASMIVKI